MLFLKSTSVTKAPGIYDVDVAAKPPGKTYGVFMATDPDNPPQAVLAALTELGFHNTYRQAYTHKDKGKVLDLGMKPQRHRREFGREGAQHLAQPIGRQHHVHRQVDLRLQPVEQPLHLGAQPVDALRDRACFRQQGAARRGEHGLARPFPLEQRQPELLFQVHDAIADHRNRTAQPPPRRRKTAGVDDREEDAELVERRRAGIAHFSISSNVSMKFIPLKPRACNP